ncbi:MAG: FoF1 ATP synthase subunit a [Anaerolineae bacterium]
MSRIFSARNIIWTLVILALIIGSALLFPVALPAISLAPEQIGHLTFFGQPFTNTGLATLVADATVLIIGFLAVRKKALVPSGIQNAVEFIAEFFLNLAQDLIGARMARVILPVALTIFWLILCANLWGRVPGVESIGLIEVPHEPGITMWTVKPVIPNVLYTVAQPQTGVSKPIEAAVAGATEEAHGVPPEGMLVPFMRAATTDLNMPLALALIAFCYIQFRGFRANGFGYLKKFINFSSFIAFFVGILEAISELAKIISFSFRLFGNIFAGTVLVFVMSYLLPWIVPMPFAALELFMGIIQAGVFALLLIIFSAGAMESHEHHPEIPVQDSFQEAYQQERAEHAAGRATQHA